MIAPLRIAKGDKLVVGDARPMFGLVLRVRAGEWVDVRWRDWSATWSARHAWREPIVSDPRYRREWTEADVRAGAPRPQVVA